MSSPETLLSWLEWGIPVVLSVVLHEMAHGYAALYFGDATARDSGRLSLNPLRHVDWIGSVLFPLTLILSGAPFMFGWAKPVPVNFGRLNNPKRDMIPVALAGPVANFLLALTALAVLRFCRDFPADVLGLLINLTVFNFSLMMFNLIPVLPLDGGRIVMGLLPFPWAVRFAGTERYGFGVIAFLLIFLPLLGNYIGLDFDFIAHFLAFTVRKMFVFFAGIFGLA